MYVPVYSVTVTGVTSFVQLVNGQIAVAIVVTSLMTDVTMPEVTVANVIV